MAYGIGSLARDMLQTCPMVSVWQFNAMMIIKIGTQRSHSLAEGSPMMCYRFADQLNEISISFLYFFDKAYRLNSLNYINLSIICSL